MAPPTSQRGGGRGGRGSSNFRGGRGDGSSRGSSRGGRGDGSSSRGSGRGGGRGGRGEGGAPRSYSAGANSSRDNNTLGHSQQQRSHSSGSRGGSGDRGSFRGGRGGGSGRGGAGGERGRGFGSASSGSRGGRGAGGAPSSSSAGRGGFKQHHQSSSNKTGTTTATTADNATSDLSPKREQLKQKVAHDIRRDLLTFFAKQHEITFDDEGNLEEILAFIPQTMFIQHIPTELTPFKSYLPQFIRRSPKCGALGFIRWYEWATHMQQKLLATGGKDETSKNTFGNNNNNNNSNSATDLNNADKFRHDAEREAQKAATKSRLGDLMKQREHMRALLAMCQRPSAAGRRQGVHALLNHLKTLPISKLQNRNTNNNNGGVDADDANQMPISASFFNNISDLKDHVDATAAYGLTRLVLGMATESFSAVLFNCIALTAVLEALPSVGANLIFSLLDNEVALTERMTTVLKRQEAVVRRLERGEEVSQEDKDFARKQIDDEEEEENGRRKINEQLNDPSRGERHQKTMAALFTFVAMWEAHQSSINNNKNNNNSKKGNTKPAAPLSTDNIRKLIQALCFLYIEHKGTRIVSANLLFRVLAAAPKDVLEDRSTRRWISFTFFGVPEIQYLRPEGIHLLMMLQHAHIMNTEYGDDRACGGAAFAASANLFPKAISSLVTTCDPLNPLSLEQYAVSLFRRDQVTSCHPMQHPVWDFFHQMITQRCAQGESLLQHLSNFLHNVITPFRRGVTDVARQELFNILIRNVGRLALQSADSAERAALIEVANKTVGFGKTVTIGKATDEATLRRMSPDELEQKVHSLGQQLRSLGTRSNVHRIRTWILKELKACISVPQFATVLPTFVNDGFAACFEFAFFKPGNSTHIKASNFDGLNQNKAVYLVGESISYRALALSSKKGSATEQQKLMMSNEGPNKCRLAVSSDYVALIDRYIANEQKSTTRFASVKASPKIRKARDMVEAALRRTTSARCVLFYKQDDLVDALLFLLFLVLSNDDPQNEFVAELAGSIVPDLVRFLHEGKLESISLLFDVLMALNMRESAPEQITPLQIYIRRLCQSMMYHFARFLKNKEDFDMILAPLINAFDIDAAQAQRKLDLEKKRKKLEKLGVDAAEDDEDATDVDSQSDDGDEDEDDENDDKKKKSKKGGDDNDDDEDDEGTEEDEDNEGTDEDEDAADSEASQDGSFSDDDDDDEDDDADDQWEQEGEEAPTAEYLNSLKALLKRGSAGGDEDSDDDEEGEDGKKKSKKQSKEDAKQKDKDFLDEVTLHHYAPVPANKAETDVISAINVATRITGLSKSSAALRTFQVLLGVMRETLKLTRSQEVFTAAENAVGSLIVSLPRFCGSFLDEKSHILLALLRDLVSYCRREEKSLLQQLQNNAAKDGAETQNMGDGSHSGRNPIEFAAMIKRNLAHLKRIALRVFHFSAAFAQKNFATESVRLLFLEHYKSIFADRGWNLNRIISSLKQDMFHFRQAFAWCFLDAAVEKLESVQFTKAVRRVRVYMDCSQFLVAFIPRLSRLPDSLLARAQRAINKFLKMFSNAKELYAIKSTLVYEFIKTLQFAAEYQKYTNSDLEFAKAIADEVISDDDIKITNATRRTLSKLERAAGAGTGQRAQNTKQVEPLKSLRRADAARHPTAPVTEGQEQQDTRKHYSLKSQRAEAAVVAKRLLKDRAATEGTVLGNNLGGGGAKFDANDMRSYKSHRGEDDRNPHHQRRGGADGGEKPLDPNSKLARKLEEQRKKQEEWEQLPIEEKKAIRAKKQQAKQDRVAGNRRTRRELLDVRDKKVTKWREEKLEKAASVFDKL